MAGLERFFTGVLALGALVPGAVAAGWDHARARAIEEAGRSGPYRHLLLEPGERLGYRVTTTAFPPRIPLFSSGRPLVVESLLEFAVLGLDEAGYELDVEVRTGCSEAKATGIEPESRSRFRLGPRGSRTPEPDPEEETGRANASQLFRDLREFAALGEPWTERRWMYMYPSAFGVRRLRTECRYESLGVDPVSGNLKLAITVSETPEERRRKRGYRASGTAELDGKGRLVRLETEGKLWKKIFLVSLSVPCSYRVERIAG